MAILSINHGAITLRSHFIAIRPGIMNIRNRSSTSLIIKTSIRLVVKRMRTSRIGFIHIFLYLGKFFVPIRLISHRPKQNRRVITIKMNRLHISLEYIRIVLAILIIECFPIFIGMMSHPANRRFYFDKHPQFITDIQHFLTRRIM